MTATRSRRAAPSAASGISCPEPGAGPAQGRRPGLFAGEGGSRRHRHLQGRRPDAHPVRRHVRRRRAVRRCRLQGRCADAHQVQRARARRRAVRQRRLQRQGPHLESGHGQDERSYRDRRGDGQSCGPRAGDRRDAQSGGPRPQQASRQACGRARRGRRPTRLERCEDRFRAAAQGERQPEARCRPGHL